MKKIIIAAAALAFVPFVALAQEGADRRADGQDRRGAGGQDLRGRPGERRGRGRRVFDLDDVMCASGQYDIKLDASYAVTEERKE